MNLQAQHLETKAVKCRKAKVDAPKALELLKREAGTRKVGVQREQGKYKLMLKDDRLKMLILAQQSKLSSAYSMPYVFVFFFFF